MPNRHYVVLHETGEVWDSIRSAALDLGTNKCSLTSHLNGLRPMRKFSCFTLYRVDMDVCKWCGCALTSENWLPGAREVGNYACVSCSREHTNCRYRERGWRGLERGYTNSRLRYKYGITVDDYDAMFAAQNGVCAICGKGAEGDPYRLCVDHDHSTNRVRGLLCLRCNQAVGYLQDSAANATAAASYLLRTKGGQ